MRLAFALILVAGPCWAEDVDLLMEKPTPPSYSMGPSFMRAMGEVQFQLSTCQAQLDGSRAYVDQLVKQVLGLQERDRDRSQR